MKRYNTTRKRPEITADAAKNMADFTHLLELHRLNVKIGLNTKWLSIGFPVVLVIVGISYLGIKEYLDVKLSNQYHLVEEQELKEINLNDKPVGIISEFETYPEPEPIQKQKQETVSEIIPDAPAEKTEVVSKSPKKEASGYIEAEPVEGFPALYNYFDENLVYPSEILDEKIGGNVIIKFTIDTTGMVGQIIIERSLHQKLDSAAVALISKMPLWKPAVLNGKPIPSTHRIPLYFHVEQTIEK